MWRTTKTRMSFVYSQSMYLPHTFYETPNSLARADGFITKALSAGGKVLVHCNGTPFCLIVRALLTKFTYTRRYFSITCLRRHVRHAPLSLVVGGCASSGTKSALLYLSKWWLLDTNQGEFRETQSLFDFCVRARALCSSATELAVRSFVSDSIIVPRNTSQYIRHPSLLQVFHKDKCKELYPGGREVTMMTRK
jgi:hypothetical protein